MLIFQCFLFLFSIPHGICPNLDGVNDITIYFCGFQCNKKCLFELKCKGRNDRERSPNPDIFHTVDTLPRMTGALGPQSYLIAYSNIMQQEHMFLSHMCIGPVTQGV